LPDAAAQPKRRMNDIAQRRQTRCSAPRRAPICCAAEPSPE
jgi:hypothetical protein